ncbi:hypothetical protein ACPYPG_29335 [Streptomyces sp. FR-108]|uniref:hypothetical protein n=1 Tax=Streptomyces sp. FR-108 TaxID=3416665 RepID=UPI003CF33A16
METETDARRVEASGLPDCWPDSFAHTRMLQCLVLTKMTSDSRRSVATSRPTEEPGRFVSTELGIEQQERAEDGRFATLRGWLAQFVASELFCPADLERRSS